MPPEGATLPELITYDNPAAAECTAVAGTEHDYRPYTIRAGQISEQTCMRCVWCHAVRCGDYDTRYPCIEPHHHPGNHRDASGIQWAKGTNRADR